MVLPLPMCVIVLLISLLHFLVCVVLLHATVLMLLLCVCECVFFKVAVLRSAVSVVLLLLARLTLPLQLCIALLLVAPLPLTLQLCVELSLQSHLHVVRMLRILSMLTPFTLFLCPPKGGRGCLMSPPCLESQGCHLIPLCYLLSCSSA